MGYWWFWLAFSLNVLVHELGHATALLLLRLPITRVVWGFGPRVVRFRLLEIRLVPIAGYTHAGVRSWEGKEVSGLLFALSGLFAQWITLFGLIFVGLHHAMPSFMAWWLMISLAALTQLVPIGFTDGKLAFSCLASLYSKKKGLTP